MGDPATTITHTARKVFSLLQLTTALRKSIHDATGGRSFWIKAEIVGSRSSPHLYLELAQHEQGVRVAVMRGIIWHSTLKRIHQQLGGDGPRILRQGSEILFRAAVQYHEVHGLGLVIEEIDLSFSLGELERRKLETIETLRSEGLFELNRSLPEPMVIQRIALVSSSGTAAYADLMEHLNANEYGYRFHVCLFNSIVQGDGAARELRMALAAIKPEKFDAVVLIRGGGSKLDLEAFNDLELCRAVARMPIPVLTGIGHETDVSVVDLIAKGHHKTPTAIAGHLIEKCLFFETGLNGFLVNMHKKVIDRFSALKETTGRWTEILIMRPEGHCRSRRGELHAVVNGLHRDVTERSARAMRQLHRHAGDLALVPLHKLQDTEPSRLHGLSLAISVAAQEHLRFLTQRMQGIRETMDLLAPEKVLKRGFSVTRHEGRVVKDPSLLDIGDMVETTYEKGRTWSVIQRKENL